MIHELPSFNQDESFLKNNKKNLIMVLIQYFLFFCKLKTISKEIDTNM